MTLLSIYNGILEALLIYALYKANQKRKFIITIINNA